MFIEKNLPTVVVITRTRWNEVPRIRHQITRQLIRFFNVIYVEKSVGIRGYAHTDRIKRVSERLIICSPSLPFPIPGRLFTNDPVTHYIVNTYIKRKIIKFIERFHCEDRILLNFEFDFPEIMKSPSFCFKIYLCNDEFPRMGIQYKNKLKAWFQCKLLQYYENQVNKNADKCLAVSYPLRDKLKKLNPDTELFLPGHEFRCILPIKKEADKKLPIKIAFMGFINHRIDSNWLLEILRNEDMFLYLIGPRENFDVNSYSRFSNIKFIPFLTGESLQKRLNEMDVLVMPYMISQTAMINAVTAPNKFFQYLAVGKPVIISDMPNFIKMPDGVIYRAKTAVEFIKKIRQAYAEDNTDLIRLRLEIAKNNTWDKRGDMLHNIIRKALRSSQR